MTESRGRRDSAGNMVEGVVPRVRARRTPHLGWAQHSPETCRTAAPCAWHQRPRASATLRHKTVSVVKSPGRSTRSRYCWQRLSVTRKETLGQRTNGPSIAEQELKEHHGVARGETTVLSTTNMGALGPQGEATDTVETSPGPTSSTLSPPLVPLMPTFPQKIKEYIDFN